VDSSGVVRERPAAQAPTGTVTLVFTDIEGSTARWERNPRAMQDALSRHDAIVRGIMGHHRGYIFKTLGDAFCVAFQRPEDAIAAALAVHDALAGADFGDVGSLRVRIALHSGSTHERDGDYFGPAVNRVARLLATGHGGQTLISGVTAELVYDRLPSDLRLVDLGIHYLKDLDRPEHIFGLVRAASVEVFPPLRTATSRANNLPGTLSSFIGRDREVADLTALLNEHRVVTIVGSGGIGKTRTAVEVAAGQLVRFPAGVWFIELAPLTDPTLIPNTIAAFVGLELAAQDDPIGALVAALKAKRVLLVLDNCEHVIDPLARVVAALAGSCPDLSILATSRQSLRIPGEHPYRMPTLSFPAPEVALSAQTALDYEAVRLFVARATALDAKFELGDSNALLIGEICRRLDGIALAIELAAARVRILAPAQLRDRLDKRLKLLTSGSRDMPARQQTLRALIDWSYDLLAPREQSLFERLGIFVDGCTLEAVTAVCAESGEDDLDVLDMLASLADKSLVVAEVDEPVRYRLLESTRDYALMKLDERGERATIAQRHLAHFCALVETAEREYERDRTDRVLTAIGVELGNVRAALAWAFGDGDPQLGARLLAASRQFWRRWSASAEGGERCERAAAGGRFDAAMTARLLNVASYLAYKMGRTVAALEIADRAVVPAQASEEPTIRFDALLCRALPLMFAGRVDEAEAELRSAEAALERAPTVVERVRLLEARGIYEAGVRITSKRRPRSPSWRACTTRSTTSKAKSTRAAISRSASMPADRRIGRSRWSARSCRMRRRWAITGRHFCWPILPATSPRYRRSAKPASRPTARSNCRRPTPARRWSATRSNISR